MTRTTLLAGALALTYASLLSARPHTEGNHANDWTPGQMIKICVCPTPNGEDIEVPLQGAMNIWNNSKAGFNGGVTFEWHLSLVDCTQARPPECDVVLDWNPGNVWGAVQPGMNPVKVDSEPADGLDARGVQRVLMHELGHVKGLGHSALSDIMKWNFRGTGNAGPNAGQLNGADAFETPNADDIALNKKLHGLDPPKAKADPSGAAQLEAEDLWRYFYLLSGAVEPGLVDPITRLTLELPSQLDGLTELLVTLLPPGWSALYFEPEPASPGGTKLDEDEDLQKAILTFWTDDPAFGVFPGDSVQFEVLSPWPPVNRRAFTNTPDADTDIFEMPVPGGAGASIQLVRLGTPPNPEVFLPGVTSGPTIGAIWDPVVDHTSFVPTALGDFMLISPAPADVPLGFPGTLLCLPPYVVTLLNFSPAAPFAVPIPPDNNLVGISLCTQVGSSPDGSSFQLTNALDLTIGLF